MKAERLRTSEVQRMEREVEEIRRQLMELETEEMTNADNGGEYSIQLSEDDEEHEPICAAPRRSGMRNNISLEVFKGDDSAD